MIPETLPSHNGGVRSWTDAEVADLHRFLDDATAERDRYREALVLIAETEDDSAWGIARRALDA